jgi:hypothetical protein
MSKTTFILNAIDIQSLISEKGFKKAGLDTGTGFLAQIKDIVVNDDKGNINPFGGGILATSDWRDTLVTQKDGTTMLFNGTLKNVKLNKSKGIRTTLNAAEAMVVLLQFKVEETDIFDQNSSTSLSSFQVDGNHTIGENVIELKNGSGEIPVPSFLSFNYTLSPRYQVVDTVETGSDTTEVFLDRGIEKAILDNSFTRFAIPVLKTIPEAIKDALQTAGITNLDDSFDAFHAEDLAANKKVWLNIRFEHNILLNAHLDKLTELGNYYLILKNNNNIGLIRGLNYETGQQTGLHITKSEIIPPCNIITDDSKLIKSYTALYVSGDEVDFIEATVSNAHIRKYKAKENWEPIESNTRNLLDYNYLYNNLVTATAFGDERLSEFKYPKWILKTKLKGYLTENIGSYFNFELGERINLSMNLGVDGNIYQEPMSVYSINRNDNKNMYDEIKFIFLNKPGGVTRTEYPLEKPVLFTTFNADNGVVLVINNIGEQELQAQVFIYNATNKKYFTEFSRTLGNVANYRNEETYDAVYIKDASLINGTVYYCKIWNRLSAYVTKKTRIIKFIPTDAFKPSQDVNGKLQFDANGDFITI